MSASLPIIFKSQIWDKEWGTYRIHFNNYIKELNLEEHKFADGGIFSNLPIQYLDNESIRKNYMAHPHKTGVNRMIIGF